MSDGIIVDFHSLFAHPSMGSGHFRVEIKSNSISSSQQKSEPDVDIAVVDHALVADANHFNPEKDQALGVLWRDLEMTSCR